MTVMAALRLGRISNLPTVWTNALAAGVVAGGGDQPWKIAFAAGALSLFYVGGMWLNDAFDAEIDARERSDRPIPKGDVSRATAFVVGFALLCAGVLATFLIALAAGWAGIALAAAVVLYDWLHKRTTLGPIIMGGARFLGYALAASAVDSFEGPVVFAALGLFAYVVALSYAAKWKTFDRWGLPRAIVTLIAGISLYDAAVIAATGEIALAMVAALGFPLTLLLQRLAPGD